MTMATLFGRIIPRVLPHDHGAADECAGRRRANKAAKQPLPRVLSRARGRALAAPSPPFAPFASLTPRAGPRGTRGSRTTRSPVPPAATSTPAVLVRNLG